MEYVCPQCAQPKDETEFYRDSSRKKGIGRVCKVCDNKRTASRDKKDPTKSRAKQAVLRAVQSGKLTRPIECSFCGTKGDVEGHHPSYERSQWLEVEWLCSLCHMDIHTTENWVAKNQ